MHSHRAMVPKSNSFLSGGNGLVENQLLSPGFLIHDFNMESGIKKNQQPEKTNLHIHDHVLFNPQLTPKSSDCPIVFLVTGRSTDPQ